MTLIVTYFLIILQLVVSWLLYSPSIFQLDEILIFYNATYFFTGLNPIVIILHALVGNWLPFGSLVIDAARKRINVNWRVLLVGDL